ncbi:hypothetical protein Patl1_25567 [Pistacia atlantica]|uniref:Uncharacterized protein n=1 Tax=Pistacia atlantica TaxID=434234 RepID=A0ACC1B055_9ROSI|nr:hypothetical protein Patl1_25567 [Pistacia atlantica]
MKNREEDGGLRFCHVKAVCGFGGGRFHLILALAVSGKAAAW